MNYSITYHKCIIDIHTAKNIDKISTVINKHRFDKNAEDSITIL